MLSKVIHFFIPFLSKNQCFVKKNGVILNILQNNSFLLSFELLETKVVFCTNSA